MMFGAILLRLGAAFSFLIGQLAIHSKGDFSLQAWACYSVSAFLWTVADLFLREDKKS